MDALLSFFDNKFEYGGERELDFFVSIPFLGKFGINMIEPLIWMQLGLILALESIFTCLFAAIIYHTILPRPGSTHAVLLGYGFMAPFLVCMPFCIIDLLDLRSLFLRVGSAAGPTMCFFHVLEAIHGTTPAFAEQSVWSYINYCVSPVTFQFNEKTGKVLPVTRQDLMSKARKSVVSLTMATFLFSLLDPRDYDLGFKGETAGNPIIGLFHRNHLFHNYLLAYLTCVSLEVGSLIVGFAISLATGINTMEFNDSPLFASTSPSNFWGKRWNLQIHGVLKRGVFIPIRRHYSKGIATVATFLASGILHEYVISLIAYKGINGIHGKPYIPAYGMHLAFFTWNGVVLVLEQLLKGDATLEHMKKWLPRPIITALVILTVLPIAHWFTDEYVESGFFSSYALAFPQVQWLGHANL